MMISAETLAQTAGDHEARRAAMGSEIARLQAQVDALAGALKILRHRMLYKLGAGDSRQPYGGTPEDNAAMVAADAVLSAAGR